jgi:hypothetical protein
MLFRNCINIGMVYINAKKEKSKKLLITSSNTWCTYPVDDLYMHSSTGDKMVSQCNHAKWFLQYILSTKEKSVSTIYLQLFQSTDVFSYAL